MTTFAFATPPVAALEAEARLLLRAARVWVILATQKRNPRPVVAQLMGPGAARFGVMMEALTNAWPDPFTTYPPCATQMSPDEATLMALLACAAANAPERFHRALSEMLGLPDRERLWALTCAVAADWMPA